MRPCRDGHGTRLPAPDSLPLHQLSKYSVMESKEAGNEQVHPSTLEISLATHYGTVGGQGELRRETRLEAKGDPLASWGEWGDEMAPL